MRVVDKSDTEIGVVLSLADAAVIVSLLGPQIPFKLVEEAQKYVGLKIAAHVPIVWPDNIEDKGKIVMSMYNPLNEFLKATK